MMDDFHLVQADGESKEASSFREVVGDTLEVRI